MDATQNNVVANGKLSFEEFKEEVLKDYELAVTSREASLIGRKEVLTGKAKFGIFGDGKELAQIALAKTFKPGDIRSGYYRDQTLMFATGMSNVEQFFAQLYANPDIEQEPASGGRMMNGHYGTRWLDEKGDWKDLTAQPHSTSDISPTAGQMVRALGIAYASKLYRNADNLKTGFERFSHNGNEVSFCTIGDASTSEGPFWETLNAAGVLKVPLAVCVWDDGYGISVPRAYQTTKNSISEALSGLQYDEKLDSGVEIYRVKGWDYASLVDTFQKGIARVREHHIPALFHVQEVTQPQGHSTSGSHERYKSRERLEWEKEMDCVKKLREFILENAIANEEELVAVEEKAKDYARTCKQDAWNKFLLPIKEQIQQLSALAQQLVYEGGSNAQQIASFVQELAAIKEPIRKDVLRTAQRILKLANGNSQAVRGLRNYYEQLKADAVDKFNSGLHSTSASAVSQVKVIAPQYSADSPQLNGFEILNKFFDHTFSTNPAVFAFGEDVGKIGDVNQGFAGLQEKHGELRISDTGIREATIVGQGLGMAMRGLRPITEIQYLDYLLYGVQTLSDDVATMYYRTRGGQKCPLIIRTRGHRLEGIWHSGSPMGMIINALRGINICVPRNMVQAAGMYNTLLQSDEPAVVVECLNGYRLKEKMPDNLFDFTVPFGVPEILQEGEDITIVSYGSTLRVIQEAMELYLAPQGISCELIDVQTLLPFDTTHRIVESLKKTNRILFIDEDVPGGASAYMFQQVMELQGGYRWLDVAPRTIAAKAHRPAYATDGDYFSKPNAEDIAAVIEEMMAE
ncbi:alpha-ketoacid dehydrogenase subunit alpha/beta [Taibaiella koreensis]|uniref:alpha-ketoacid dehydrogenase subunit alpha/beta n=1 Tax=Taibaiella koreensis TaxID=1268548 RepID=UPI000E59932D|nr:alpha-ketoacid dehydrogenase subunit alpha/beta [Taibaiella koreensis]